MKFHSEILNNSIEFIMTISQLVQSLRLNGIKVSSLSQVMHVDGDEYSYYEKKLCSIPMNKFNTKPNKFFFFKKKCV